MQDVEALARAIVRREGGYVNDPSDPGGPTKHGVTLGTLRALGRDIDGDGDVDLLDVKALTEEQAVAIYIAHYFRAPGLDRLPALLQPALFDAQVHMGARAVRLLQAVLNEAGFGPLAEDGICGPGTAASAERAAAAMGDFLADAYGIERRDFYYRLADRRPESRKYVRRRDGGKGGWITRAEAFISPRFHLSDREHRARVAAWA